MKFSIFPKTRSAEALESKSCIYSVSLSTDEVRYQRMLRGYEWAIEHFVEVNVYLGDGMLLENTFTILGSKPTAVRLQARGLAEMAIKDLKAIARPSKLSAASTLAALPMFTAKLIDVTTSCAKNEDFAASVMADARSFVERQAKRSRLGIDTEHAISLARQYVLFEIAVYAVLASEGYLVDVYAGSEELPTLQKFMNGELTGLPELAQRTCILLRP